MNLIVGPVFTYSHVKAQENLSLKPLLQVTIEAMKKRFPKARLFSLFEPRSATSRRSTFQEDYVRAFQDSDAVFIAPPFYQDKIPQAERFSSEKLANDLARSSPFCNP